MVQCVDAHDDLVPLLKSALLYVDPRYKAVVDKLEPHTKLSELGIDSLAMSEMAAYIEDLLAINLRDADLVKVVTLADFGSVVRVTRAIGTMPETVLEMLLRLEDNHGPGPTFLDEQLTPEPWTFAELVAKSKARAAYFQQLGARAGDRIGLIIPDGRDFVPAFHGAILGGFIPVPIALPVSARGLPAYLEHCRALMNASTTRVLVVPDEYADAFHELQREVETCEHLVTIGQLRNAEAAPDFQPVRVPSSATCFLQFTSGSTSAPKGVDVTHANLMANVRSIIIDGLNSMPGRDRAACWLPLYHDMGLIGFVIAPLLVSMPTVFMSPQTFIRRPQNWMRVIHEHRATISFGPNFAFGLASKRAGQLQGLDLSCLRALGCGAEPINHTTLDTFIQVHRSAGLRPEVVMPVYGLAEATLAVSFDRLDRPYRTLAIDRQLYESDGLVAPPTSAAESDALRLVSCGRAFSSHELCILDDDGQALPEGKVGEIGFAGPSRTRGYWGMRREQTDWLLTGDLGFTQDGELYIAGRKKDLIVVRGKNFYPQAIEWELEKLDGVRRGNIVAFPVQATDTEGVVIVTEVSGAAWTDLKLRIADHMQSVFQLVPIDVVLVKSSSLPKTTSGKLQRGKTKALWLNNELSLRAEREQEQEPPNAERWPLEHGQTSRWVV